MTALAWSKAAKPAPQAVVLAGAAALGPAVAAVDPAQLHWVAFAAGFAAVLTNPIGGIGPFRRQRWLVPLGLLLVFAAASTGWSADAGAAWRGLGHTTAVLVCGVLLATYAAELDPGDRRLVALAAVAGALLLAAAVALDRAGGGGPLTESRAAVMAPAVCAGAGALATLGRPWLGLGLLLAGSGLGFGLLGHFATLALLAAAAAGALAWTAPRLAAWTVGAGAVCAVLAPIVLAVMAGEPVGLFGSGVGSTTGSGLIAALWRELGATGLLLLAAIAVLVARPAAGCGPARRAAGLGTLAAGALLGNRAFGIEPWALAALLLGAATVAALPDPGRRKRPARPHREKSEAAR